MTLQPMVKVVASMFARLQSLGADAVQPYEPWAPWQGRDYDCCDCNESWGTFREGVKTWEPWLAAGRWLCASLPRM